MKINNLKNIFIFKIIMIINYKNAQLFDLLYSNNSKISAEYNLGELNIKNNTITDKHISKINLSGEKLKIKYILTKYKNEKIYIMIFINIY